MIENKNQKYEKINPEKSGGERDIVPIYNPIHERTLP